MPLTLKLLTESDYVLNACGRLVPPPGYRFVDLTRIIPFSGFVPMLGEGGSNNPPSQFHVSNASNTLFLCKGIATISNDARFRVKWPTGRFLNQNVFSNDSGVPYGVGGNMLTFRSPVAIEKGGKIGIEIFGDTGVNLEFWGVLRYLLKEDDRDGKPPGAYCIMGYPVYARSPSGAAQIQYMTDPIETLERIPRYQCGPNQNIMAAEWALGDSPSAGETPAGFNDESFTFFSQTNSDGTPVPLVCPVGQSLYGNPILIPGHNDVILKRWRSISVWDEETSGTPAVSLRMPSGYSLTGGDLLPMMFDWLPVFPTMKAVAGTRLIWDLANIDAQGDSIATYLEFDAVKRTRIPGYTG
jgi:hypothetical protein